MGFSEGVEKAGGYAKQALELMDTHDVPPAPPNYAVWYNYVSERYPDLKKALDKAIDNKLAFNGPQNETLYDTFIGHIQEGILLKDTGEEMQDQAQQLLQVLGGVSSNIQGFSSSIKSNIETFSEDKSLGGIEVFVQNMMLETRRIQESNAKLQAELSQSSEKIKALQENLIKVEQESHTDTLTNIANRKKFDITLSAEMKIAEQKGHPLCLVIGDIDYFKKFNDAYGHQVGDEVLKLVARSLHENVKGGDLAARYGGEEFALILPNTSIKNAFSLVETIRETIGSRRIRNKKKGLDFGSVTLSLGLAQYREGDAACDFIERADDALYRAKSNGRNQTLCETS